MTSPAPLRTNSMSTIEKALVQLKSLRAAATSSRAVKPVLKNADIDLIRALTEIYHNVKEDIIILTPSARQYLRKKKNFKNLIYCSKKLKNWKLMKKRHLTSGAGLIPYILPSFLDQILPDGSGSSI